jgi:hypothetical protein
MRDLPQIRHDTFKFLTIKYTFENVGIWPINYKLSIYKMRTFRKKRQKDSKEDKEPEYDLLKLIQP